MDYSKARERAGSAAQLFGATQYRLCGGRAEGVLAADVRSGAGLEFTVLADRCMDIGRLSYKGVNCAFLSPCGVVAPAYYDARGIEFLRGFTAGFLTTCGLTAVGSPCVDDDEELGLHGRIANTPAEGFACETREGAEPLVRLRGRMAQARLFGENLVLEREIVCRYGENQFELHDVVRNEGPRTSPLMQIYHMNLGYPLLDEGAELLLLAKTTQPRNTHAAEGLADWMRVAPPQEGFEEMCYYHDLAADEGGRTLAALYNPSPGFGVAIRFNKAALGQFIEWKLLGPREYELGLEPANCRADGRDVERREGRLQFLAPGEEKHIDITVEIFDGTQGLQAVRGEIEKIMK